MTSGSNSVMVLGMGVVMFLTQVRPCDYLFLSFYGIMPGLSTRVLRPSNLLGRCPGCSIHIGLVPPTDVDVHIVSGAEVISLGVRLVIPVRTLESLKGFVKEGFSLAVVVVLVPVGVHIRVATGIGLEAIADLVVAAATDLVGVANEVNHTRLEVQHNGAMVTHTQRTLDSVLGEHGLEGPGDFCLEFLIHVCHV